MARRNGRPGDYLFADFYTGFTKYRSQVHKDFWGSYAVKPLARNLQEVATPLLDPYPVPIVSPGTYEVVPNICVFETLPLYVGNTTVRTPTTGNAAQALYNIPAIPDQEVGCTNVILP